MPVLQIKSQGFPNLVQDLGVQSPLAGPFWGLETTVVPTYIVGASQPVPQLSTPYPFQNFDSSNSVNPLAGAVIARTVALERGRYNLEVEYWFSNAAASTFTFLVFQAHDAVGGTLQLWEFDLMTLDTQSRPTGKGRMEMSYENVVENGFFDVQVSNQVVNGSVGATMRWLKTGDLRNF